jgi:predicted regulator of Ras-like GTPase activity (Roadblock/LC7/MglB family)
MPGREPEVVKPSPVESSLVEITSLLGVSALLIVDENGDVQHQWYRTLLDRSRIEVTGPDITELTKTSVNFVGRIGGGILDNMILRSENSTVLIQAAGRSTLFIFSDKRANLALLLIRAKRVGSIIASTRPPGVA